MSDIFAGSDWDVINTSLTGTYVEVTYTKNIRGFRVQARGEKDVRHKRKNADTKYVTIKAGSAAPYSVMLSPSDPATTSLGFFAVASGSETLESLVFF